MVPTKFPLFQHRHDKQGSCTPGIHQRDHAGITIEISLIRREICNLHNLFGSGDARKRELGMMLAQIYH
jgi:hypothetical protein